MRIIDKGLVLRQLLKVHQIDQIEVAKGVDHKTLDLELSPQYPPKMQILHDIDNASGKVFADGDCQFFCFAQQIKQILPVYPPAHEVDPVLVAEVAVMFGDEVVVDLPPDLLQICHQMLIPLLQGSALVEHSQCELHVALGSDTQSAADVVAAFVLEHVEFAGAQGGDVLLDFADAFHLLPSFLFQLDQSAETAVKGLFYAFNTDESHVSAAARLLQIFSMMLDIHQIVSIQDLQFHTSIDSAFQTDDDMRYGVTFLGNDLIVGVVVHFSGLDHGLENDLRDAQVFGVFEGPDQFVCDLQVKQAAVQVFLDICSAEGQKHCVLEADCVGRALGVFTAQAALAEALFGFDFDWGFAWDQQLHFSVFDHIETTGSFTLSEDDCFFLEFELLRQKGQFMFLLQSQIFEDSYVFNLLKNFNLCSFAEFQADPRKILALKTNQFAILSGSCSGGPRSFVINAQISKASTFCQTFTCLPISPLADLYLPLNNHIEVIRRVPLGEDELPLCRFERFQAVHDLAVGVASRFKEQRMVKQGCLDQIVVFLGQNV